MAHRFVPMRQTVIDTFADNLGKIVLDCRWDIFAQHVSAKRKRQICLVLPPFAKIDNLLKTRLRVRELTFVNDETGVSTPGFYLVEN